MVVIVYTEYESILVPPELNDKFSESVKYANIKNNYITH